jgi:hypothetical protein
MRINDAKHFTAAATGGAPGKLKVIGNGDPVFRSASWSDLSLINSGIYQVSKAEKSGFAAEVRQLAPGWRHVLTSCGRWKSDTRSKLRLETSPGL